MSEHRGHCIRCGRRSSQKWCGRCMDELFPQTAGLGEPLSRVQVVVWTLLVGAMAAMFVAQVVHLLNDSTSF